MADNKKADNGKPTPEIRKRNKTNRNISGNVNELINQLSSAAFGSAWNTDVEDLNSKFADILKTETDTYNRNGGREETSSFISNLFRDSKTQIVQDGDLLNQLNNLFDDSASESSLRAFIDEAYKNKLLKQSDLHEVSSQLIELREAILITRDAIISSDVVEGKMTRNLKFDNTGENDSDDLIPVVEAMEKKFKLQDKIKNFIIPKTLEYGEYYAYVIPYAKIFSDFMKRKESNKFGRDMYHESTLYESVYGTESGKKEFESDLQEIFESVYEKHEDTVSSSVISRTGTTDYRKENEALRIALNEDVNALMKNITICNDALPLNILEEGTASTNFFMEHHIDLTTFNEADNQVDSIGSDSYFNRVVKSQNGDGVYNPTSKKEKKNVNGIKDEFKNFHDCYLKMINPIQLIPVQIMNRRLGYYYVQSEQVTPVNGVVSSSLYYNRFEDSRREQSIIDAIATKIVTSFDKKFLDENIKFKELIVEALNYYNLNEQRVRFQFIPAEYIVAFKVTEDENGNGTSIIEPSLFYAKLYLMLLLFKMMSIILYSNDQRINYIRTSGIDKNVRKKVEEIARKKQQRSINVMDMFSYTSLVNKLGIGAETYMPTGKSNERGIETEVIQGQDVQLNTDLMDKLNKAYILGTGVPDAIMNYMNEADFAKSLELANTRFQGRVVSYQYDFNEGITDLYRRMLRWSSNLEEQDIEGFEFAFAPPKTSNAQIKADILQNFDTFATWVIGLKIGQQNMDQPENEPIVRNLKELLAKDYLPMINFANIDKMFREANINGLEELLQPTGEEPEGSVDDDLKNL